MFPCPSSDSASASGTSSTGLQRTPTRPTFHPPRPSFSLCVSNTVVWGQGRGLPSPYVRYTRPPKPPWKTNHSPDKMSPFQRQSLLVFSRGLPYTYGPSNGINTASSFFIPTRFIPRPRCTGSQPLSAYKHL